MPRTTAQGTYSAHSTGRACDIYLDAYDRLDKKLGDLLFKMFYQYEVDLKVDHVIWDHLIWSKSKGGPRPYTDGGGPHTNHIHVAFNNEPLTSTPGMFVSLCKQVHAQYVSGGDGAADREDGLYGKAFNPKNPNVRLTSAQRKTKLLTNMGM